MSKVTIELAKRDWKEFSIQNTVGVIERFWDEIKITVEIMELPGEYVTLDYVCPFEITEAMVGRTVIGDYDHHRFHIRIFCLYDVVAVE